MLSGAKRLRLQFDKHEESLQEPFRLLCSSRLFVCQSENWWRIHETVRNETCRTRSLQNNVQGSGIQSFASFCETHVNFQMTSIERLLEQGGASCIVPQATVLSVKATHLALIVNINHIVDLVKNSKLVLPESSSTPPTPSSVTPPVRESLCATRSVSSSVLRRPSLEQEYLSDDNSTMTASTVLCRPDDVVRLKLENLSSFISRQAIVTSSTMPMSLMCNRTMGTVK